jgi:hypothetical protein
MHFFLTETTLYFEIEWSKLNKLVQIFLASLQIPSFCIVFD